MQVKSCKRTSLLTITTLLLLSILLTSVTPWGVVWLSSWLLSVACALCTSSLSCLLSISTLVISCISLLLIALRSLKIEMGLSQIFQYFHFLQKKKPYILETWRFLNAYRLSICTLLLSICTCICWLAVPTVAWKEGKRSNTINSNVANICIWIFKYWCKKYK